MGIKVIDKDFVSSVIKPRARNCNKGDFGRLLCVTSCKSMTGAGVISAKAALRSGVGLCTVASVKNAVCAVQASLPEATCLCLKQTLNGCISKNNVKQILKSSEKSSAVLIGCGLSVCRDTEILVEKLIKNLNVPIILDADGINIAARNIKILKSSKLPLIITPHIKEMGRLCGLSTDIIKQNPAEIARDFAKKHNVYVVLKDYITYIATPLGDVYKNEHGHPCMAKGGSGDMLSGVISAFAASGIDPVSACCAGVYIHSIAGEICGENKGDYSVLASDMIDALPEVFCSLKK